MVVERNTDRCHRWNHATHSALVCALLVVTVCVAGVIAHRLDSQVRAGTASATAEKTLLTLEDLEFEGFIRLNSVSDSGRMYYAFPGFAMRKVNGQTRFFTYGGATDGSPVYEFALPAPAPQATLASAPAATFLRNWGTIMNGHTDTGGCPSCWYPGGLYWDQARNALWWTYGDSYVPVRANHPTLGATILNDNTGTAITYGPWRQSTLPIGFTRGSLNTIPQSFANAYTGGKNVGVSGSQMSGVTSAPFGAALTAVKLPDPATTPPDSSDSSRVSVPNQSLIIHDIGHPQARDTRYKISYWNVANGSCSQGFGLVPGPPVFLGGERFAAQVENDTMNTYVWIDLPDKHGIIFFGLLVTTPEGYRAPGDPDGFVHAWYGNPERANEPPKTDCYGQEDPWWGATGPGAHVRVPMGWIYNPNDLIDTAQGKTRLWDVKPANTFQWFKYFPQFLPRAGTSHFGGAVFDQDTRRLYILVRQLDDGFPVIYVFRIKGGPAAQRPAPVFTPFLSSTSPDLNTH